MWNAAIQDALAKTKANIGKFGEAFPWTGVNGGDYKRSTHEDWTEGFWSGLLWLCYEYSLDPQYREAAVRTVASFERRLAERKVIDHHDIGFLYLPSAVAQWIIEGDESARALGLRAADCLMERWRAEGQYLQAWGEAGDPVNGGRIIIDCLLNLPLLYWASQATGDNRYHDAAYAHAQKSRRYLVRGDDSSFHTFSFDIQTGEPVGGSTHQGYSNGSTWTRGQAWGIYGFILSYIYTGDARFLETSRRMAHYFISRLPEDSVTFWDFDLPEGTDHYRDSSATAIACCGILELLNYLKNSEEETSLLRDAVERCMTSLVQHYSTINTPHAEGLLKHGSYYVRGNLSPDDYVIWGDYFYLEALMRLEREAPGYWYERKQREG
ncbi:MAG: glycosyl hydrolase family 88 [Paenibacillaceae bacterium]|jgi:unsaturated chondroitin disaccharide hydrolase|nr:glycosyl hydrolase family 88 [Paenibacillaceae bacterium]